MRRRAETVNAAQRCELARLVFTGRRFAFLDAARLDAARAACQIRRMDAASEMPPSSLWTRRALLRAGGRVALGTLGLGASAAGWGRFIEPDWVQIEHHEVILPRLGRAFDGFRLAQISDVHIEGGAMREHFPAICQRVTALGADLIVLTGDYITAGQEMHLDVALVNGFRWLRAAAGVWGVLGNHDQDNAALVRRALARGGVRELRNTRHALRRGNEVLWLCGLDDWGSSCADLPALMAQLPAHGAAIALQHQPDSADALALENRFDLMLSGHSHGGQIALPFWGPLHLPLGAQKYPRGFYQLGEMRLYTNRGLGTIGVPVRFCARPEITVFTLRAPASRRPGV